MKEALAMIKTPYQLVLSDCMPMPGFPVPVIPLVKGDAKCLNIAAASILAKVTRDRYMEELEKKIQELSKGLQEAIESYNKVKTGKTYTVKVSISDANDFSYEDYYDMYRKVLSNILK